MAGGRYEPLATRERDFAEISGGHTGTDSHSSQAPVLPELDLGAGDSISLPEEAVGLIQGDDLVTTRPASECSRSSSEASPHASSASLIEQDDGPAITASPSNGRPPSPVRQSSIPKPAPFWQTRSSTVSSWTSWTRGSVSEIKESIRYSLTPEHHIDPQKKLPKTPPTTARIYSYLKQSKRLWRLAAGEWLITAILCTLYAAILLTYSKKSVMSRTDKTVFNALTSALSFLLGVNLAASLRSYAKLLRWLILSMCYRPLETFDLVLGCDSFANVIELIFKAKSKKRFAVSRTQILCMLWLVANVCTMLAVTCVSLTYNIDNSSVYELSPGTLYITNFDGLWTNNYYHSVAGVQSWGQKAALVRSSYGLDYHDQRRSGYTTLENGTTRLWLHHWNPQDEEFPTVQSWRYVQSVANCTEHRVTQGQWGNETSIVYEDESGEFVTYTIPDRVLPQPGGLLASSEVNSTTCGSRCTAIHVFLPQTDPASALVLEQPADSDEPSPDPVYPVEQAKFFRCQNTVGKVRFHGTKGVTVSSSSYQFENEVAQILAGAIGWSLAPLDDSRPSQLYMAYEDGEEVTGDLHGRYSANITATDMSDFVSSFTVKAMAMLDDWYFGYPVYTELEDALTPMLGVKLTMDWRNAVWLLMAIPGMQGIALVLVFLFANRAIIKDDSHLSIAKLYYSLLKKYGFGEKGCLLRRERMVKEMESPEVAYGWIESNQIGPDKRPIGHLDIFDKLDLQDTRMDCSKRFEDGRYFDGLGVDGTSVRRRANKARDFDATLYF